MFLHVIVSLIDVLRNENVFHRDDERLTSTRRSSSSNGSDDDNDMTRTPAGSLLLINGFIYVA